MNNHLPGGELLVRPASFNDISFIQDIAAKTWPVAYSDILSHAQMHYMLGLFYSTTALQQQLSEHHYFYLALLNFKPVGFASFSATAPGTFKLQKLYLLPGQQKTGTGRLLLHTVEEVVKSMGGEKLQLNVNRANASISFYKRQGFAIVKEEDINIGQGYFMNDYVMEKALL
jgi:ribosomal protein S18 acetylase RimI-like enzyme